MKKITDILRKAWSTIFIIAMVTTMCISNCFTGLSKWYRSNSHRRRHSSNSNPNFIHINNRRVIPFFVVIIIVLVANKNGIFEDYPGIQAFVNIFLNIVEEMYKFGAQIIERLIEDFNIPKIWEDFQTWFWNHWIF